jgi:outer membrane biosynthesis protein TonB
LFVTHATSPDAYTSIRDFAAGLAYFGKPARAPLIRELYERCAAAGLPSTGHLPRRIAVSNKQPSAKSPAPETSARTRWTRGATVATAASLAGAGIWFWSSTETDRTTKTSLPTLISEVKSAMQTLESDVSTYLGFRPPPIRGAQDAARPKATHASSRLMKPRRRRDERQPISSIPLSPDRNQQAVTTVPLLDQSLTIDEPARAETRVEDRQVERAIYSSHDADVRPPVLQFPQLASARGDSRPDVMNRMELVVSADGTVEHVRLVAGPNRMTDMMLLSGAKMWRFTPAVKDGKPVRYRTVVSWIAGP